MKCQLIEARKNNSVCSEGRDLWLLRNHFSVYEYVLHYLSNGSEIKLADVTVSFRTCLDQEMSQLVMFRVEKTMTALLLIILFLKSSMFLLCKHYCTSIRVGKLKKKKRLAFLMSSESCVHKECVQDCFSCCSR